jgi:hypothetical protein
MSTSLQYTIVSDEFPKNFLLFIDKVNEKLDSGWQLQGGIAVNNHYYYQALVREIDVETSSESTSKSPERATKAMIDDC